MEEFGEQTAFCEPAWYQGFGSPYYTADHAAFRAKVRAFVDREIVPNVAKWEAQRGYPEELHRKAYEAGVYAGRWPLEYGGTPPPGGWDTFYAIILSDELARCGAGGVMAALYSIDIGLPPVLAEGADEVKREIVPDIIRGNKIIALAITEPEGGSDVAAIRTTAVRQDGYYVVNGAKKFITSGMRCSYFTTAVRTGGAGMQGVSLLVIPRHLEGVRTLKLATQGWHSSNTALVSFNDVRVPVKYLLGAENDGFKAIMVNFNGERLGIAVMANRYARICLRESIRFAQKRQTFGRPLIKRQVIRHKLSDMARRVECTHAMIENVANVMNVSNDMKAGRMVALLKVEATDTFEFCAKEASQILGGASYLSSGVGATVERLYREVRVLAIGGGSTEIMKDLSIGLARL
mmetsp:Transcript_9331/g.26181  ORF Transcript_9331/g.26181 Transcript_9331/m.26181 type:complete len:406 (+) Transcript_9331:90-1307(+)